MDVRGKEGLPQTTGVLAGAEPPDLIEIHENGLRFWVDVKRVLRFHATTAEAPRLKVGMPVEFTLKESQRY